MKGWSALGFKHYIDYLSSDIWQAKRDAFLFYNPLCKYCNKKATQVHHLSYEHCPQEKENELIALCSKCHKLIHRKNDNHTR